MKQLFIVLLSIFIFSCNPSKEHEGEVVKNVKGEYFILRGEHAFGEERYELIPIDTNKYKTFN